MAAWTINVKLTSGGESGGGSLNLPAGELTSVSALKQQLIASLGVVPRRIIFQGKVLSKDEQTLKELKLSDGCAVHVQPDAAATQQQQQQQDSKPPAADAQTADASGSAATASTAAAAAAATAAVPQRAVPQRAAAAPAFRTPMQVALSEAMTNPPPVAHAMFATMIKIVDNIMSHPLEDKYRSIKKANKQFASRVGDVTGGNACMRGLGFNDSDPAHWVLVPSASAWPQLKAGRDLLQQAHTAAQQANSSRQPSYTNTAAATPAFPPAAGLSGMQQAISAMTRDPSSMQRAMQDPSLQQALANDARITPQMRTMLRDPGMMQQMLQQFQRNPQMAQQMQQMMQSQAGGGLGGTGSGGFSGSVGIGGGYGGGGGLQQQQPNNSSSSSSSSTTTTAQPSQQAMSAAAAPAASSDSVSDDAEMTEDDMIAQAIARSMQEM